MQYNNYCHDFTYQTVLMCMQRLLEGMFRVRICNEQHENNCVKANFCGVYAIRRVRFNYSVFIFLDSFYSFAYYSLRITINIHRYCIIQFHGNSSLLIRKSLKWLCQILHAKDSTSYPAPPGDNFSTPNRLYGRRLLHF